MLTFWVLVVLCLQILSADGNTISLDSSSENHCNWMSLVQVARTTEEQNCIAYQLGINIYFNTTKDIATGTPLKVWYAWKYAQKLGKPIEPDGKTKCEFAKVCKVGRVLIALVWELDPIFVVFLCVQ